MDSLVLDPAVATGAAPVNAKSFSSEGHIRFFDFVFLDPGQNTLFSSLGSAHFMGTAFSCGWKESVSPYTAFMEGGAFPRDRVGLGEDTPYWSWKSSESVGSPKLISGSGLMWGGIVSSSSC